MRSRTRPSALVSYVSCPTLSHLVPVTCLSVPYFALLTSGLLPKRLPRSRMLAPVSCRYVADKATYGWISPFPYFRDTLGHLSTTNEASLLLPQPQPWGASPAESVPPEGSDCACNSCSSAKYINGCVNERINFSSLELLKNRTDLHPSGMVESSENLN